MATRLRATSLRSRGRRALALAGAAVLAGAALFTNANSASPFAVPPSPYEGTFPPAHPPDEMAIHQLPTGVTHRTAAFAYRGGSYCDKREFAMTAVLVTHPRGDLLIDTGLGRDIDEQFQTLPLPFRAVTSYARTHSVREQLDAAGYDSSRLRGVLLTHAHWDHVSGLPELRAAPVLVTAAEHEFIASGGALTALVRGFEGVRYEEYSFDGGPYLGFPASHDFYGDGSVVIVPAAGHTPGSVVVFVSLPSQERYALIGDLVWQLEGITEREERPWPARALGDTDRSAVRENILRIGALMARFPELRVVPAHDVRGYDAIPLLSPPPR